jgi:hypothetical protein
LKLTAIDELARHLSFAAQPSVKLAENGLRRDRNHRDPRRDGTPDDVQTKKEIAGCPEIIRGPDNCGVGRTICEPGARPPYHSASRYKPATRPI